MTIETYFHVVKILFPINNSKKSPRIISFMPKLQSYYDYIVVVEADFGSTLNNSGQVGFWKFDSKFCPNNYDRYTFKIMSAGHSQARFIKLILTSLIFPVEIFQVLIQPGSSRTPEHSLYKRAR